MKSKTTKQEIMKPVLSKASGSGFTLLMMTVQKHYLITVSLLLLAIIRFTANIPILYLSDSQKFICPRATILSHDINAIWLSVNFSLLERVVNYFIQVWFNDDLSLTIVINKFASLLATLLVYLIVYKAVKNRYISLASALVFSLSPALLYIESAVMAEAVFIFFILLFTYLFQWLLEVQTQRTYIILAIITGVVIGLAEITKQTADTWALLTLFVIVILGLIDFFQSKKTKFLIIAVLIYIVSFLPKVPVYMENAKVFGKLDFALQRTVDSGKGVLLWSLTEDMVYSRPQTSYPWLTDGIISLTEQYKQRFATNDKNANTRPFYMAISQVCVAGRQGQISDPHSGQLLTTEQWTKICAKYWREVTLSQPKLLMKRILETSLVNMFMKEDLGLFIWENSIREGLSFQTIQSARLPFSFDRQDDPAITANKGVLIKVTFDQNQMRKAREFYSYYYNSADTNHYYVMFNMDSDHAFQMPINSFSIWWQKIWAWMPWIYCIGPVFLIAVGIYIWLRSYALFDIFIFCSVLYFSILPLLISLAEARYRLQFIPFMIIFVGIVVGKILAKKAQT